MPVVPRLVRLRKLGYPAAMRCRILIALLGVALAGAVNAQERGHTCINPDAMAKFTLDCAKNTSNSLTACYETASKIYCKADPPPPPPPQVVIAPPMPAAPAAAPAAEEEKAEEKPQKDAKGSRKSSAKPVAEGSKGATEAKHK